MEKKLWSNAEVVELGVESTREDGIETADEKYKHSENCDRKHWPWEGCNKNNLIGNMLPGQGVDTTVPTFS